MNWTKCSFQDFRDSNASLDNTSSLCSVNVMTPRPETRVGMAATALSGSIGVVALILLLVGLLSVIWKKWRHERLFKEQLRHQAKFLHKSPDTTSQAEAVYSNVIYLVPQKEDDFAIYANVSRFHCPRRMPPDQVEYASIVFH